MGSRRKFVREVPYRLGCFRRYFRKQSCFTKTMFHEDEEYVLRSQQEVSKTRNMFYEAKEVSRTRKGFRSTRYEDEKVFGGEGFSEAKMFFEDVFEDDMGCRTIDVVLCAFFWPAEFRKNV